MSTDSSFRDDEAPDAQDATTSAEHLVDDESFEPEDGVLYDDEVTPEFGILGFTLRELLIVGVWLVAFIASFFPHLADASIWGTGIQWILPIGVPTVAVFLLILRRFSPDGIRRVGSLGIDQFASVAFSVAAVYWIADLWNLVAVSIDFGIVALSANGIVQLVASLALVVLTVFAPLIPGLKEDFHGRLVTLAHRNANPVRPVIARPRPESTPRSEEAPTTQAADGTDASPDADGFAAAPPTADGLTASPPTADGLTADGLTAAAAGPAVVSDPAPTYSPGLGDERSSAVTTPSAGAPAELDVELSGQQATDEVARLDIAEQVPLASHASGGGTGTEQATAEDDYVPSYSRRSWNQEPEIVSDTGSIESLMGTTAQDVDATETTAFPAVDPSTDADLAPAATPETGQPFWILAPTERDVHDERGDVLFRIGPSAWALVIEDRGGAYVVRHDDGRIGYLHDIADITKG
ncbi:hypothetical protein [Microbacterium sp. H83]|uniref:hypothetical protein n=1 Tax=Microbacterium sp. H83 TaxID=1827324 RepID=UPI000A53BB27|nr:hypothetical protein [Microbacterium sp. H83]